MKIRLIKFFKVMVILIMVEVVLFILMIFFLMSDEPTNPIGEALYFGVKYIFGFPLVLINDSYPFFLESKKMPVEMIPLVILNNLIQTSMIVGVINIFIKNRHRNA